MKHLGTKRNLLKHFKRSGIMVVAIDETDFDFTFTCAGGGIVNWFPRTGKLEFQGPLEEAKLLESKLTNPGVL